ncbi:hypothetical protein EMIHUDRAFT_438674 [Emiliania huxleyi CCMP1516]|uniref:Choline transporter-like protein n=4 Tax=Emiliania huxleyi TaxID=2903 RepID=A0A0D3I5J3_EMIH1|nr:hypothetical protein EMIHUDRAFT_438674 [Emiliania huxleyi CCMP1516]EOD06528.1 hypothetical protein EMIHUDRAFT_438674 [Emiliania huxleyi CCMP1516]|eukprot:XP_005758957.1 hypothetical protein EMIHUDRAFT_438674 [Emiliania huxleyi CCMP1516]
MDDSRLIGVSPLKLSKRASTDVAFVFVFLLSVGAAVACGLHGAANGDLEALTSPPEGCGPKPGAGVARRLLASAPDPVPTTILRHAWYLLPLTAIVAAAGGGMVLALRSCARPFVYSSMALIPISMASSGAAVLSQSPPLGYIMFGVAALYVLLLWCSRRGLRLCAALLENAAVVLVTHPSLLLVCGLLLLTTLAALAAGLAGLVALYSNGAWEGAERGECEWVVRDAAEVGLAVVGVALLWSTLLSDMLRFFIVSLVTSVWYYDTSAGAVDPSANTEARRAPVRLAARLAFTRSLGTLCFSSLVLTLGQVLKALARDAVRRSDSPLVLLVACCLRCVVELLEFINKFAIAMHAITGDGFCASGKQVTALLAKHGLSAWFCDRISAFVLRTTAVAFAALGGVGTYLAVYSGLAADEEDDRQAVAGAFGGAAFVVGALVLSFCSSTLLDVVDASYTCLALDLDRGAQHRPPMRDAMLPIVKPEYVLVVAQPGSDGQPRAIAVPVAPAPQVAVGIPAAPAPQ